MGCICKYWYYIYKHGYQFLPKCNDSYICGEPTTQKDNTHINICCLFFYSAPEL